MAASDSTSPELGKRVRNRLAVEAQILVVARGHLATEGAAALSLRAVARDLGMVSSGIYRYVESRDELLTRLIVDSYTSLAAAVRRAHDAVPGDDLIGRWHALGHAMRDWALAHPHDFALLYGSPVPDYEAPADRTGEAGTAVLALLFALVDDDMFTGTSLDAAALAQGICAWTLLLGAVTSEVFGQLGPVPDPAALFDVLLAAGRTCLITDPIGP